jgi:hypothetical protein
MQLTKVQANPENMPLVDPTADPLLAESDETRKDR